MTAQTRVDEVISQLVTVWTAAPAITALKAKVYDGPFVTDLRGRYRLFVGSTGVLDDEDVVEFTQMSPHAANVARDETMFITCAAWYAAGSTDMAAARANSRQLLDAAIAYLRTDLGITLANMQYGGMDSGSLRYVQSKTGAAAVWTFVLRFVARIYS